MRAGRFLTSPPCGGLPLPDETTGSGGPVLRLFYHPLLFEQFVDVADDGSLITKEPRQSEVVDMEAVFFVLVAHVGARVGLAGALALQCVGFDLDAFFQSIFYDVAQSSDLDNGRLAAEPCLDAGQVEMTELLHCGDHLINFVSND